MSKPRVRLDEIQRAIGRLERRGETPSIRRVQQEIGYDYARVGQLMRRHGLTQATMNRMEKVRGSGARLRRRQQPRTGQRVKRPAGQGEPRHQQLERAQASEPSIEPYKALLIAILDRAMRDARSCPPDERRGAWRWLRSDPACAEICDWLDLDQRLLIKALEQCRAGAA